MPKYTVREVQEIIIETEIVEVPSAETAITLFKQRKLNETKRSIESHITVTVVKEERK